MEHMSNEAFIVLSIIMWALVALVVRRGNKRKKEGRR